LAKKQHPGWVFAMRMALLDTTLQEERLPNGKRFIITGTPVIKNLSWIIYGPAAAALAALLVGALSWLFKVREQEQTVKLISVCFFALSPALAWVVAGSFIGKLAQKYLDREVKAGKQRVTLNLDLATRALQKNAEAPIPFDDIEDFKLVTGAGVYYAPDKESVNIVNLIAHTKQGRVTLLPKELGSLKQKLQIVSELEALTAKGLED